MAAITTKNIIATAEKYGFSLLNQGKKYRFKANFTAKTVKIHTAKGIETLHKEICGSVEIGYLAYYLQVDENTIRVFSSLEQIARYLADEPIRRHNAKIEADMKAGRIQKIQVWTPAN